MKPTIKMIADYAGVSRGVVDRVLHGRPNVNPDKRRRVEEALKKLNYTPDAAARALALKNRKMKIAVLMPQWGGMFGVEVMRGIEAARTELGDYGLEVLVRRCESDLPEEYIDAIDALTGDGVRGLAVCAKNSESMQRKLRSLSQSGIPVVTFNSDIPKSGRICFVGRDDIRNGRIAAEIMSKLLPRGAQTLVVCGNREFEGHRSRVDGFCARYAELGRGPDVYTVIETYNDYDVTCQKVCRSFTENPAIDGVYMANESIPGCVEALKHLNRAGEVRVVCHDLYDATVRLLREGLVDFAIEQNMYRQGFMPVSILTNFLIAGKKPEQEIELTRIHIACAENIY